MLVTFRQDVCQLTLKGNSMSYKCSVNNNISYVLTVYCSCYVFVINSQCWFRVVFVKHTSDHSVADQHLFPWRNVHSSALNFILCVSRDQVSVLTDVLSINLGFRHSKIDFKWHCDLLSMCRKFGTCIQRDMFMFHRCLDITLYIS